MPLYVHGGINPLSVFELHALVFYAPWLQKINKMKQHRIYIRVTEQEKTLLKERAQKTKKTLSEYILLIALKRNIVFTSDEMLEEVKKLKIELRNATNIRNKNPKTRELIDPIREGIHSILKYFS